MSWSGASLKCFIFLPPHRCICSSPSDVFVADALTPDINVLKYDHHMEPHDYIDAKFSYSLLSQITKPTRITPTTATLIYIIYNNNIIRDYNQLQGILH